MGDKVGGQVWYQVGGQVRDQVWGQVRGQVMNEVWNQVGVRIARQLNSQIVGVWNQTKDQVKHHKEDTNAKYRR